MFSSLLDQTLVVCYLDMDEFHQKLTSWSRSLFGPSICHLKFCSNPFHGKSLGCNTLSDIVVVSQCVSGMLCDLIWVSRSDDTLAVKVNWYGCCVVLLSIPNSLSSIFKWLVAMKAVHPHCILPLQMAWQQGLGSWSYD
jgi:hypothetical protein